MASPSENVAHLACGFKQAVIQILLDLTWFPLIRCTFPSTPSLRLCCPWQQQQQQHSLPRAPPCFCSHSSSVSFSPSHPHGATSVWTVLHMPCWKRFRQMVGMGARAGSSFTSSCLVSLCLPANMGRLQSRLAVSQKLFSGSTNSLSLCSSCMSCNHSVEVLYILSPRLEQHGAWQCLPFYSDLLLHKTLHCTLRGNLFQKLYGNCFIWNNKLLYTVKFVHLLRWVCPFQIRASDFYYFVLI